MNLLAAERLVVDDHDPKPIPVARIRFHPHPPGAARGSERNGERCKDATAGDVLDLEVLVGAVQMFQDRPRPGQPNPFMERVTRRSIV